MDNAQIAMYSNVYVVRHNMKKGGIIQKIGIKNRVTSLGLTSIAKLLSGSFTNVTLNDVNIFVPNYVAIGSYVGQTSVSCSDRQLEIEYVNNENKKERLPIVQRNFNFTQDSSAVILELKSYIMEEQMVNYRISELGLFTNKDDNTCWARVILPSQSAFIKEQGEIVDIVWKIIIASV